MRLAVVGAGWAGLAAAVEATYRRHAVTLYDMAPQPGGRARRVESNGVTLDNGQHILIGAYLETLRLMRLVGAEPERLLMRMPLRLAFADGAAFTLPPGPPTAAFVRAVLRYRDWRWTDKFALLLGAAHWARRGFRCDETWTVARLTQGLPACVRADLIEPLCVAALNTPAPQASAQVFLRVLRETLYAGPGTADLLLPRVDLGALWPEPATRWLTAAGATSHLRRRVGRLRRRDAQWLVDDETFDAVVLATSTVEAARLAAPIAPAWAAVAADLRHEPIATVTLRSTGARLPVPMLALRAGPDAPAQFVFDLGQLRGLDGTLAFVISGASEWAALGAEATLNATVAQARRALGSYLSGPTEPVHLLIEKRATFLCTPGLARPAQRIAARLVAAGDHVAGPYPATLEGAVRSGVGAVAALEAEF